MKKKTAEIKPITLDEIKKLNYFERIEAMARYRRWVKKQRAQDKRESRNEATRIDRFKKRMEDR